ncbi:MAG: hypothetical protein HKN85_10055 [Gammaproteobacteria bacterium]|nr:hypothetical protein [Gammaproteobacteria bacterium]
MVKLFKIFLLLIWSINAGAQGDSLPCDTENNNAFDFFVGEWRVTDPAGKHAGDSVIDKIQDGCVIRENWRSAQSKYTGTSYNFYNRDAGQWEQIWLDNQGGRLHLKGQKKENQMILVSDERPNKEGLPTFNRITWTDNADGSVRQYWEVVSQGKPVTVAFDGLYKAAM